MKRYFTYFLLIPSIFSQDGKLAVSILDFTGEDVKPKVLKACFQRLETSLIDSDQFIVIEKSEREEILKEQQIQSSGICDTECVVDIGQLLGAEYLMLGEIIDLSGLYQIDIKIINVEKGDVTEKVTKEVEGRVKDLLNAMERASDEIIRRISIYKPDASQLLIGQTELIEEVKYGRVNIYSEPSDAIVLIDNDRIGSTPIENKQVEVGTRNLKIIKKGYVTINKGVKISETEIAKVDEVLMMKTGGINITTMPIGSKVFLDDKFVGLSPIRIPEVIIGQHQITASHEDYLTGLESIIVEYDKIKDIKLNLSPKLGSVNIVLSIADVDISINYKNYPSDPSGFTSIQLVPGEYEVRISKTGYKTETRTVKILPNRSETLEIEMYIQTNVEKEIPDKLTKKYQNDINWNSAWTHKLNGEIDGLHFTINMDEARIRSDPFDSAPILGSLTKGTKLTIADRRGDYLKIESPIYHTGSNANLDPVWARTKSKIFGNTYASTDFWIRKKNGRITNNYILIDEEDAIIRSGPSYGSRILGYAEKGDKLRLVGESGSYVSVIQPLSGFNQSKKRDFYEKEKKRYQREANKSNYSKKVENGEENECLPTLFGCYLWYLIILGLLPPA